MDIASIPTMGNAGTSSAVPPSQPQAHPASAPPPAHAGGDRVELSPGGPTNISYSYDEELNQPIVKVYDSVSGELLRQIPPEATRRFAQGMLESISSQLELVG